MNWRFPMKGRFLLPVLLAVLAVAGCGGGGAASLKSDDVAVVGSKHIPKTMFDALMGQAKRSFASQKRKFPKQGTTDYATIKNQAITLLVQQAEREEKAADLGIHISDKDVQKRLDQIKKQYFGGSQKRYEQQLKKQGLTDAQVRQDIKAQLISEQVFNKITKKVSVSDSEVHQYYVQHPQLYAQPQSRDVRHILVKSKSLADRLYTQIKGGANFATLAKKYSQDPGSKTQGGKLTVSKGQTVPQFDKVAFSLKTGELSKPVHTQYGWHIIQALSAVKAAKKTPFSQVKEAIRQQLLQTKRQQEAAKWWDSTKKDYAKKVSYASGLAPATTSTSTTPTTTG